MGVQEQVVKGIGSVRVDDLDSVLHSKQQKHMAYHQMNIEYATLASTTYGRIKDDFVRVLWFMASRSNRDGTGRKQNQYNLMKRRTETDSREIASRIRF